MLRPNLHRSAHPAEGNFETSPVRVEYDAVLQEYQELRAEFVSRLERQQELTNYAIAVVAALGALVQFLPDGDLQERMVETVPFVPLVSILLSCFTLMTLDHDLNMALILSYINDKLGPTLRTHGGELTRLSGQTPLRWNQYRASIQHHGGIIRSSIGGITSVAKYGVTVLPNLGALGVWWWAFGSDRWSPSWVSWVLLSLAMAGLAVTIVASVATGLAYTRMRYSTS